MHLRASVRPGGPEPPLSPRGPLRAARPQGGPAKSQNKSDLAKGHAGPPRKGLKFGGSSLERGTASAYRGLQGFLAEPQKTIDHCKSGLPMRPYPLLAQMIDSCPRQHCYLKQKNTDFQKRSTPAVLQRRPAHPTVLRETPHGDRSPADRALGVPQTCSPARALRGQALEPLQLRKRECVQCHLFTQEMPHASEPLSGLSASHLPVAATNTSLLFRARAAVCEEDAARQACGRRVSGLRSHRSRTGTRRNRPITA